MELHDCNGVNCPLGIAHPPPCRDPSKGGVFPLGCGICRSEKLAELKKLHDATGGVFLKEDQPEFHNYKKHGRNDFDGYGDEYGDEFGDEEGPKEN